MAENEGAAVNKKKNLVTKMDSCDTLAEVDINFKDMRTCDGPCKGIFYNDQLEVFKCCHAICGECLNESTDIEIQNGKFLCPVTKCRHGNAERNISAVKEYAYLKQNFIHSRQINYSTVSSLSDSEAETSISMVNIIAFDQTLKSTSKEEKEEEGGKEGYCNKSQKEKDKEERDVSMAYMIY